MIKATSLGERVLTDQQLGTIGCALLRVALGSVMLVRFVWHTSVYDYIWGIHSQVNFSDFVRNGGQSFVSLFRYCTTSSCDEWLLIAGILVSATFISGFHSRLIAWPFAILSYSFLERNFYASDAGFVLLVLLSWILCFVDTGKHFVLLRIWRTKSSGYLLNSVHNLARFLIVWQVGMVYFWAAFYKLQGTEWRDGSALHYVLSEDHFSRFALLNRMLLANPHVTSLLTLCVLYFQCSFLALILIPRVRVLAVLVACSLHVGIAAVMGLFSFSTTMIAADLALLSDSEFMGLWSWIEQNSFGALSQLSSRSTPRRSSRWW